MHFVCLDDSEAVAVLVKELLVEAVHSHAPGAIALPTGKTPLSLYALLTMLPEELKEEFRRASWFALDEFLCAEMSPESSFRHFLLTHFVAPLGIDESRLFTLSCSVDNPEEGARTYEERIRQEGGLKLALLGLGLNGHIGFNEPGTPLDSRTGKRALMQKSREANAYLFSSVDATPCDAVTMGIGTILEARRVVMMATGDSKAEPVAKLRSITVPTSDFPASVLLAHPDAWLIVDRNANHLELYNGG